MILAYVLLYNPLFSQGEGVAEKDSVFKAKPEDPHWQYARILSLGMDSFHKWDSTFFMVQRYNRLTAAATPFVDLGTTASPHKLLAIPVSLKHGFQTGISPYSTYNKTPDSLKFYRTAVPWTRFYYTQGGNGVFILDAVHTQNFSPTWNVVVDFSSVQNGEIYSQSGQDHLHRGTALGSHFVSKNRRYRQTTIFSWNRARRNENRGLFADTLFFIEGSGLQRLRGRYFPGSSTASSYYASRHHSFEQSMSVKESGKLYVFHKFDWLKEIYQYTEDATSFTPLDSAFYGNFPVHQAGAFKDSSVWNQWNNAFGMGSARNYFHWPITWKMWYNYDRMAYNSLHKISANTYENHSVQVRLKNTNTNPAMQFETGGAYYVKGWNSGDYLADFTLKYSIAKHSHFFGKLVFQKNRPQFISERFSGNYLQYSIDLKQTKQQALQTGVDWKNERILLKILATAGRAENFLFVDSARKFNQLGQFSFARVEGFLRLRAGKLFLENRFTFQAQNHQDKIPFPTFSNLTGLYFQGPVFKKAMLARIGLDAWYMSSFTGYHYNPLNATFYPGKVKSANYPYLDFYVSGEVKTVMFFIKTEHINESLTNYGFNRNYASALGYPSEPFRFRFGMVWRFYN